MTPEEENKIDREYAAEVLAMIGVQRSRFWEYIKAEANKHLPPEPIIAFTNSVPKPTIEPTDEYVDEMIDEIRELVEEVPDEGEEFAISVSEKVEGIAGTIDRFGRVTQCQLMALENMRRGLQKWVR